MAYNNRVREKPAIQWSEISLSSINLEKIKLLTHTPRQLLKNGYLIKPFSEHEMWAKMRCQNCGAKLKRYRPPTATSQSSGLDQLNRNEYAAHDPTEGDTKYVIHTPEEEQYAREVARARAAAYFEEPTQHICFFHDGLLFKGEYKCCGGKQNTKGCCSEINHLPSSLEELRQECWMHTTPKYKAQPSIDGQNPYAGLVGGRPPTHMRGLQSQSRNQVQRPLADRRFHNTIESAKRPQAMHTTPKRAAIALDCEMGTTTLFASTLIRLTAVDFFTREVLIDSLVAPAPPHYILHYNTRYSGVTFAAMRDAIRRGNVIHGADTARELLFQHIDSHTIVIVHGGDNDFKTLRWLHPVDKIVDTCILETYDPEVTEKGWKRNLKEVTQRRCNGIKIQNAKLMNGRDVGHDSLEDALACREIVIAWMRMIPDI